jgi:hypothetical protein
MTLQRNFYRFVFVNHAIHFVHLFNDLCTLCLLKSQSVTLNKHGLQRHTSERHGIEEQTDRVRRRNTEEPVIIEKFDAGIIATINTAAKRSAKVRLTKENKRCRTNIKETRKDKTWSQMIFCFFLSPRKHKSDHCNHGIPCVWMSANSETSNVTMNIWPQHGRSDSKSFIISQTVFPFYLSTKANETIKEIDDVFVVVLPFTRKTSSPSSSICCLDNPHPYCKSGCYTVKTRSGLIHLNSSCG